MSINASPDDKWIDKDGNELQMIAYDFSPTDGSRCVLYGTLSNGEKLPFYELIRKYRKIGLAYIKTHE